MPLLRRMSCLFLLVAVSLCTQACSRQTSVSGQVFITVNVGSSIKLGGVDVLALSRTDLAAALSKTLQQEEAERSRLRGEVEAAEGASREAGKKLNALQAQLDALSAEQKAARAKWMYSEWRTSEREAATKRAWELKDQLDVLEKSLPSAQREALAASEKRDAAVERAASRPTVDGYFASLPKPIASAVTNADGAFSIVVPTRERFALAVHATRRVGDTPEEHYWLIWIDPREKNNSLLLTNRNSINPLAPSSVMTTWAEAVQKP